MDFTAFQNWAFLGLLSGGIIILWQMKENVAELNSKMGVVFEKLESLVEDKNDHEKRLRHVEHDVRLVTAVVAKDTDLMSNLKLKGD